MPEKPQAFRAKRAKRRGTMMTLKPTDIHTAGGMSTHHAKKRGGQDPGEMGFADRTVSACHPPGQGLTARSLKLPTPGMGSSLSRRKTLPVEAAVGYRKEGSPKHTRGRGDVPALRASKKLTRRGR